MRGGGLSGASATVVLVEGESDRLAVETLAARLGCDLVAADAAIVCMGGITNLRRHLAELSAAPVRPRVLGLFDAGEIAYVNAVVERDGHRGASVGSGTPGTIAGLASLGYFACEPDLEGELIRALGTDRVERLLAEHGELTRSAASSSSPRSERGQRMRSSGASWARTAAGRRASPRFSSARSRSRASPPRSPGWLRRSGRGWVERISLGEPSCGGSAC